jgi:hypothetical protein
MKFAHECIRTQTGRCDVTFEQGSTLCGQGEKPLRGEDYKMKEHVHKRITMKATYKILMLMAVMALAGCAPKSDSGVDSNNMNNSSPKEAPAAETPAAPVMTNLPGANNPSNNTVLGTNAPTPQQ